MSCSCSNGLDEIFGDRMARHEARRFRRKGPSARSRKLLDGIRESTTVAGASTLEIGAGIGALTITLLREGAASASIVDAVAAYVATARNLAEEFGVAERLDVQLADYATIPHADDAADIVVMDRVVCCHPRWIEIIEPASRQARSMVAMTYPRDAWWTRAGIAAVNFVQKIRGLVFRVYVHPVTEMHATLRNNGFQTRVTGHHGPWEILIATRTSSISQFDPQRRNDNRVSIAQDPRI
jgi:cyclopropane fatty-acyl-phospholipid synthase-like methyltransferase